MKLKNLIFLLAALLIGLLVFFFIRRVSLQSSDVQPVLEFSTSIRNHKFDPDIIMVPSGRVIHLTIYNNDNTVEEFESIDLHREKIIMPNDRIKIILAPLKPGKYDFFGDFHQDTAHGSIIVK